MFGRIGELRPDLTRVLSIILKNVTDIPVPDSLGGAYNQA